jgi:hypothetical protein|tara:strand:- start:162 stop:407 length:246 start_codon:yes stop_codon:yes gene_type:complete
MIDKLFRRTSQQIVELEQELEKLLAIDTKDTTEKMKWPLYQRIEKIIDLIAVRRNRRQFIVNNLITDIGEMEEHVKKSNPK